MLRARVLAQYAKEFAAMQGKDDLSDAELDEAIESIRNGNEVMVEYHDDNHPYLNSIIEVVERNRKLQQLRARRRPGMSLYAVP